MLVALLALFSGCVYLLSFGISDKVPWLTKNQIQIVIIKMQNRDMDIFLHLLLYILKLRCPKIMT